MKILTLYFTIDLGKTYAKIFSRSGPCCPTNSAKKR